MKKYSLNSADFIGSISNFPEEVLQVMLNRQEEQGNSAKISVFQERKYAPRGCGGFNWESTSEGWEFWDSVLTYYRFDEFFNRYPKINNLKNNDEILLSALIRLSTESDNELLNVFGEEVNIERKIAELSADFPKKVVIKTEAVVCVGNKTGQVPLETLLSMGTARVVIPVYEQGKKRPFSTAFASNVSYNFIQENNGND